MNERLADELIESDLFELDDGLTLPADMVSDQSAPRGLDEFMQEIEEGNQEAQEAEWDVDLVMGGMACQSGILWTELKNLFFCCARLWPSRPDDTRAETVKRWSSNLQRLRLLLKD